MSDSEEKKYARIILKFDVWDGATDRNAVLRAGAEAIQMSVGAVDRGLAELVRLGQITRNGDNYTITDAGRTAREVLLAQ